MLEHFSNQASGLLGLCASPGPRVISVVHHGDEQAELPMLWQLCLALVGLGYMVTVLDATIEESPVNPGLNQLFDNFHGQADKAQDTPTWSVLPSKMGFHRICTSQSASNEKLFRICQLFPVDTLVILYCGVEPMVSLIGQSDHEPLLPVSPVRTSLLTSYIALKRLLITGNLRPTIVNMLQKRNPLLLTTSPSVLTGLHECAKKFLGFNATTFDICEQPEEDHVGGDMQRLALRMLERTTLPITSYELLGPVAWPDRTGHSDQFARSY